MTESFRIYCLPAPHPVRACTPACAQRISPPRMHKLEHYGLSLAGPPQSACGTAQSQPDLDTTGGRKLLKGYRPNWQADTVDYTHSILRALPRQAFRRRAEPAPDRSTYVDLRGDYSPCSSSTRA